MSGFEFDFDGRPVPAEPGQTVGAALTAAGVRSWRTTREGGRPRGLFCGIGVCFDCLVTVNGRPNLRACLIQARPGDTVQTTDASPNRPIHSPDSGAGSGAGGRTGGGVDAGVDLSAGEGSR